MMTPRGPTGMVRVATRLAVLSGRIVYGHCFEELGHTGGLNIRKRALGV
jgi:hypothetical protein